jgi:hypothetical protein
MVLGELCSIDLEKVWDRLDSLKSVLVVPDSESAPIRIFHTSFRDFLLDKGRHSDNRSWINDKATHRDLFNSSVELMSTRLKRDICEMHHPGARIDEIESSTLERCLPIHSQYACQYWVGHLEQLESSQQEAAGLCDGGKVHIFLKKHFLHWIEALSIIENMSDEALMVRNIESMLTMSDPTMLHFH